MAFAGLHVAWGFAGSKQNPSINPKQEYGVLHKPETSETIAAAGTSTSVAPTANGNAGPPLASIIASADSWVAFGAAPDATTGARVLMQAGVPREFYVTPGDKVAFILA